MTEVSTAPQPEDITIASDERRPSRMRSAP